MSTETISPGIVQPTLMRWSSQCSHAIGSSIDLCKLILDKPGLNPKILFVVRQLMTSCHITSESALLLIGHARLWDAEMLIRSVVEGSLRFTYLCTIDDDDKLEKATEFWDTLPECEEIRTHNKLKHILAQVDNSDADEWHPLRELLLSDEQMQDLQAKYPSSIRKRMEQHWSFGNLSNLTRIPEIPDLDFRILQFNYGMSSHLIHKDATALGVIWDRLFRDDIRRSAIELAHGSRMISDVYSLSMVRMILFHGVQKSNTETAGELAKRQYGFLEEMQEARRGWHQIEYAL